MVRVKICGITRLGDAIAAVERGADALGFVFYEKSPRRVTPDQARRIIRELPPFVTTVGVFVDTPPDEVNRILDETGLDRAQLHGDETPEACAEVGGRVIKAIRVRSTDDINRMKDYPVGSFLLDAYKEGMPGGTGLTFDWKFAREAEKYGRIILSGGLNPGNVREAVERVQPYGVDVSSGVETSPGEKDGALVTEFIRAARSAETE